MVTNPTPPRDDAPELLPCPFCGEKPRFYPAQAMIDGDCPEAICCGNDGCPGQPSTDYLPISDAIAAWNTRRADQPACAVKPLVWEQIEPALKFPEDWRNSNGGMMGLKEQRAWADGFQTCRGQIAELIPMEPAALLPTEAGAEPVSAVGSCATENCDNPAAWLFESGNVTSKYCNACYRKVATPPAAPTDNTALVEILLEARSSLSAYTGGPNGACSETIKRIDAALSRPAPQAVTVEQCLEAINQVKAEAQADLYGAKNDFNRGAVDAIDRAYARVRALGGRA